MEELSFEIRGNVVDVVAGTIHPGTVVVKEGRILEIRREPVETDRYILPGLIDAHIHIESSMLIPSEFARLAVIHGTTGTVSDPHEIANVLGIDGVRFMIANGKRVPFRFWFGAPSCVPATPFETAGAIVGIKEVGELLAMPEIRYLSEMMNFPGVLSGDAEVMQKLKLASQAGKPVDGHAPGVRGLDAARYIAAGITTDHECFSLEEAIEKIGYGMHILIREGSAARNFETLWPLIDQYPDRVMICSDDKHPDDLVDGHIDQIIRRALAKGLDPMNVIRSCSLNPVRHYKLDGGLLQPGDPADLVVVDNLASFHVMATFVGGIRVAENGKTLIPHMEDVPVNRFRIGPFDEKELKLVPIKDRIRVMTADNGQLITGSELAEPLVSEGNVVSDTDRDILKIVVRNRYAEAPAAVGFIRNFGLRRGAIASSVAHDSHNIVAVGADDRSLAEAVNLVIEGRGGIARVDGEHNEVLPLPFAGIMTGIDGFETARRYRRMDSRVKEMGSSLSAPYMTLSFMALLVIPDLKLSDRGLFDGKLFRFTGIFPE